VKGNTTEGQELSGKLDRQHDSIAHVGIVGCGWLGTALATTLINKATSVIATRSSEENCSDLIAQGINAEVLLLPTSQAELNQHAVFACRTIVIAITPQFRNGRVDYPDKVKQVVTAAEHNGNVKQIILLSSSAVYNGLSGVVTEDIPLDFSAEKVSLLYDAELAVLGFGNEALGRRSHVLRLSGLVGENRHPGKFLAGKSTLAVNAKAQVNLIHQEDAVGIITRLLSSKVKTGIFNGVSATKATKQDYYQAAAKALSLPEPIFSNMDSLETVRVVNGDKVRQLLSYQFVYPDLLSWL
jgi:nucleoside-diphosphate-sugar epimerase